MLAAHSNPVKARAGPGVRRHPLCRPNVAANASSKDFVQDCMALGKCRFIVVGDGAILETVNAWSAIKFTEIPSRGMLATVATPDKTFECHINLTKVTEVKLAKSQAKQGGYDIYATRFLVDGKVALSCLLHGDEGVYPPGAVEAWSQLVAKYGDAVTLTLE